jgi:hypothetical protein
MRIGFLIAGLALAVLIIGAFQWFSSEPEPVVETLPVDGSSGTPPTPPTPVSSGQGERATPAEVAVAPEMVLPPLNDSDAFVREQLAGLELPDDWLAREDLARRAAVVVDNTARGEFPARQLDFLSLGVPFKVIERGGELYLDPANYDRYNSYVDLVVMRDPAQVAELFDLLSPLLEESLLELGNQLTAREQLLSAIDQVLAVPIRAEDIRLIQPKVLYEFAEPRLEKLTPLQKQVLRSGPGNTEKLQNFLARLRPQL